MLESIFGLKIGPAKNFSLICEFQVIRKGYMGLHTGVSFMKGGAKNFWYVLTKENLSWFKDDKEKDKTYTLPLDQLKIRDHGSGFFSKRHVFALFNAKGK